LGNPQPRFLYIFPSFKEGEGIDMKQIKINDELTTYYITSEGRLFNQKTGNWLKGTVKGGYLVYSLRL
jgi:hypothetical protein